MDRNELLAALAALLADDAPAPAPVSAPVTPRAASPFTTLVAGKAVNERWPEPLATYARNAPAGIVQRVVREAAAFESVPGFSCDAVTRTLKLGDETRDVGHGFTVAAESGSPCKTKGCTGKIR